MNCDINDIGAALNCDEQQRISGRTIYAVRPSDLANAPRLVEGNTTRFAPWAFDKMNFLYGRKAFTINARTQTPQSSSNGIEGPKGFGNSLTFIVERDIEACAAALRVMKNDGDWYFLVPFGNDGAYQVIGDPVYGSDINGSFDSGTTADSEMGITFNISVPGSRNVITLWYPEEGVEMPDDNEYSTVGMLACVKYGTGTHVDEDYYRVFHAIGNYVSGTESSRVDILGNKASVIVEWSKNPYTDLAKKSFVNPGLRDSEGVFATYSNIECTNRILPDDDGNFVLRSGDKIYTKYTKTLSSLTIGHNVSFTPCCVFSGYDMPTTETLQPVKAYVATTKIGISTRTLLLYTDGTGLLTVHGTKFGSDYKYAVEVGTDVANLGDIRNFQITNKQTRIYVNVKEVIPGDKLVFQVSNYIFEIPIE